MKYYKVINAVGWSFKQDKIYPEDYKGYSFTIKEAATRFFSKDFKEVPAGDYFVQEGKKLVLEGSGVVLKDGESVIEFSIEDYLQREKSVYLRR